MTGGPLNAGEGQRSSGFSRRDFMRGAGAVASAATSGGVDGLASLVGPGTVGAAVKMTEDVTELFYAASGLFSTTVSGRWQLWAPDVISRHLASAGAESDILEFVAENVHAHFLNLQWLRNAVGNVEQHPEGARLIEEVQRDGDALMAALREDKGYSGGGAIAATVDLEENPTSSSGPSAIIVLPLDGPGEILKLSPDSEYARLDASLTAKYGRPSAHLTRAALVLRQCLQPFGNRAPLRWRSEGNFCAELPQTAHTVFLGLKQEVLQLFKEAAAPKGVWRSPAHQEAYRRLGDSLDISIKELAEEVMTKYFPEYMAVDSPHRRAVEKELTRRSDRAVEKQRAAEVERTNFAWPGSEGPGNDYY